MDLHLKPGQLTLSDLRQVYHQPQRLTLDPSAAGPIDASVACVERIIAEDRTAYGINTGFGLLASTRIAREDLEALQSSLVLSHAAGVGEPLDDAMVRLIMVLKINSLARGYSGIRRKVIDALIALVNAEVYPHIPLKGSVGASATWRRWRTCPCCCWARTARAIAASGCRPARRWKSPACSRSRWRPRKAWRC